MNNLETFLLQATPALPEILLAALTLIIMLYGVIVSNKGTQRVTLFAVSALAIVALVVSILPSATSFGFFASYVHDGFGQYMKLLVLLGGAGTLAMTMSFNDAFKLRQFEFPLLVLFSVLGMMFMISANDLMLTYVGLELMSLPIYVLVSIRRDHKMSSEAGMKYFVLGALASGMILYGISLIYGFTGVIHFDALQNYVEVQTKLPTPALFGFIMLICGFAFKLSAVPFHMWTPDVYEGAPSSVTAFLAIVPKIAVFALLTRIAIVTFGDLHAYWQDVFWLLSVGSMALGAFAALPQNNIKRLLAYSTIGHMGYALIGITTGGAAGVSAMVLYMTLYMVMNIGVFSIILSLRKQDIQTYEISQLAGLSKTHPTMALMMTVLLFSMAGIPPLAGFFGKLVIFQAAVSAELYGLAIIGVLTSVVAAYYYLRLIKTMYFDEPTKSFDTQTLDLKIIGGLATGFVLLFILNPSFLIKTADYAVGALGL